MLDRFRELVSWPLVTRGMLKQAVYWGTVIWLIAILTGLLRHLFAAS